LQKNGDDYLSSAIPELENLDAPLAQLFRKQVKKKEKKSKLLDLASYFSAFLASKSPESEPEMALAEKKKKGKDKDKNNGQAGVTQETANGMEIINETFTESQSLK